MNKMEVKLQFTLLLLVLIISLNYLGYSWDSTLSTLDYIFLISNSSGNFKIEGNKVTSID